MFQLIKSSMDGISVSRVDTLREVLDNICYYRGWEDLQQLHDAIIKWATSAKIGSVFSTQATAIVYAGVQYCEICPCCEEELQMTYGEFEITDDGLTQEGECEKCGAKWIDTFALSRRLVEKIKPANKKKKKQKYKEIKA